jgi:hypothetical protein
MSPHDARQKELHMQGIEPCAEALYLLADPFLMGSFNVTSTPHMSFCYGQISEN